MTVVRQSTARTVIVGPALDADGVAVTDLAVGDFLISKDGGNGGALDGSATLTHRATGHYSLALTATDLNTVGETCVYLDDGTNAIAPLRLTVIEEAAYDALYAASAPGPLPANSDGAGLTEAGGTGDHLSAVPWNAAWDAEVQSECADALDAYDPPTSAELEARTLAAASYATASALGAVAGYLDTEIAAILEDTGTTLPAQIGALNNLSAAEVNAQVDAALSDVGLTTTVTGRIDAAVSTRASQATVDAIEADTQDIQGRIPDALVSGSIKANITHVIGDAVQESGATDTNWGGTP